VTLAEQLASAEDNSLESEIVPTVPTVPRAGAAFRRTENGDREPSAESLGNPLHQLSRLSMGEIDSLISELQTLRRKLQTDGDRIEWDIAKYAELNQQVMQLTTIISDSVLFAGSLTKLLLMSLGYTADDLLYKARWTLNRIREVLVRALRGWAPSNA
jgi:hypothetical protein